MIRNSGRASRRRVILPRRQSAQALEAIADGYFETDLEWRLTGANSSLCRLVGCPSPAQLLGEMPRRFVAADDWARILRAGERVLASGEPIPALQCPIQLPDGTTRVVEFSLALLRRGATASGFCGIMRDVTARAAAEAESAQLIARLEAHLEETLNLYTRVSELEQLKTHMIRVAAHDLRSPLSIIASYVELLHQDLAAHYNEMDETYVNAIRQAISRIRQMTSDILSLERLHESGDVPRTPVPLDRLLGLTVAEYADETRQRQQQFTAQIEPVTVSGDALELHEALANLLGNAIKYTPSGGTISAALRREGAFALVEVVDNGFGIPADQQAELFQPFHRIRTRETYTIDGTGLG